MTDTERRHAFAAVAQILLLPRKPMYNSVANVQCTLVLAEGVGRRSITREEQKSDQILKRNPNAVRGRMPAI